MTSASVPVPIGRELFQRMAWQERAACVTSLALIGVLLAPVPSTLRLVVALAFMAVAPGTALLAIAGSALFGTGHPGLIVALGLAQVILLGEIALWAHAFYPRPELAAFAAVAFAVVVIAVHRRIHPSPSAVRDGSDPGFALFVPPGVTSALDVGGINLLPAPPAGVAESGGDAHEPAPDGAPVASDMSATADDAATGEGETQLDATETTVNAGTSAEPASDAGTAVSDARRSPGATAAPPAGDADASDGTGHAPTGIVKAQPDASDGTSTVDDPTTDADPADDNSGSG